MRLDANGTVGTKVGHVIPASPAANAQLKELRGIIRDKGRDIMDLDENEGGSDGNQTDRSDQAN